MAQASSAETEVRRCAKCGEAAVLLVTEWHHTFWGVSTQQSTRDFRCHGCGAKFSLVPRSRSIVFIVMGLIMGCAVFPLGFSIWGWLELQREKKNPVVPGASLPRLRYRDGPPVRRCDCGHEAVITKVTKESINGLPTGIEYQYRCEQCQRGFIIDSPWGHCVAVFSSLCFLGVAAAFFWGATVPGWRYGGAGVSVAIFIFLVFDNVDHLVNRFRYSVVETPLL